MSWETANLSFDEVTTTSSMETPNKKQLISEENEQKRLAQLQNFKGQDRDEDKATYKNIMAQFGQLLTSDNKEEITKTILTENCEIFLFTFADIVPAEYAFRHEGFIKLFEKKRVIKREVKETFISLNQNTGFQICECEVIDESKGSSMSQFSFEIFSFRDNKLSKYRASYGSMPKSYNPSSLFIHTKKECMLARVKELNYAWADQPDLEKIASLLPDGAEYKIYRWKDKECFTFNKHNLVSDFKKCLEKDFAIKCVVPYGISCESQYIFGSYVYHLEGKNALCGHKFIWVSTCIFVFDQNSNIKKITQQGELYPEDEESIPFQAWSQKKLRDHFSGSGSPRLDPNKGLTLFDTEGVNFSFDIIVFGPRYALFTGHIKGLSQFDILGQILSAKDKTTEKEKVIDIFEDLDDPCYDSIIMIEGGKGTINREGHPFRGIPTNFYSVFKFSFENGKVAKVLVFLSAILDPIPSPFDNSDFIDLNFRSKSEFL